MRRYLVFCLLLAGCSGRTAEKANARGLACLEKRDNRCAVAAFVEASKAKPDSTRYRYNLGLALARSGLYEQSVIELQEVIRKDPADLDARRTLGKVQAAMALRQGEIIASQLQH